MKKVEDWKTALDVHFMERKKSKKEIEAKREELKKAARHFMKKEALPAFEDLKDELNRYKRDCEIDHKKMWAALLVRHNNKKEFVYELKLIADDEHLHLSKSIYVPNDKGKLKLGVEGKVRNPDNSLRIDKVSRTDIIADFLESYKEATRVK